MSKLPGDRLIGRLRQSLEHIVDLFIEAVHIELTHKAVPIRMLEVFTEEQSVGVYVANVSGWTINNA
jgi:hypothetical protein